MAAFAFPQVDPIRHAGSKFLITKWTTEHGLPQNTVTAMTQTRDGYIWLGTFGGLVRFDGVTFTVFDPANTPGFTSPRVLCLFEDSKNRLWIGTESGDVFVISREGIKKLGSPLELKRGVVWGIDEDSGGNLLIASTTGLELFRLDGNDPERPDLAKVLSNDSATGITRAPDGVVWVRLDGKYFAYDDGRLVPSEEFGISLPEDVLRIRFAPDGKILTGAYSSVSIRTDSEVLDTLDIDISEHNAGGSIHAGPSTFWYQRGDELYEMTASGAVRHSLEGFLEKGSRDLLEDNEGNLWIGTQGDGLIRLSRRRVFGLEESFGTGLPGAYAVAEDAAGRLFVAGSELLKIHNGNTEKILVDSDGDKLPLLKTLAFDQEGRLWAGGETGLFRFMSRVPEKVEGFGESNIQALFFEPSGTLWVGTEKGLIRYDDEKATTYTTKYGLADDSVHYISRSRDGTLWVGTKNGASRYDGNEFRSITAADGLPSGAVRDIFESGDGSLWFATYGGGLARLKDGKISGITRASGLPNDFVSRILPDDRGRLWLLTNDGVFAAELEDLTAVANGEADSVYGVTLGVADGMPSSEGNGGHQPAGIRLSDGRFLFPTIKDVALISPAAISGDAPKVMIEHAYSRSTEPQPKPLLVPANLSVIEVKDGNRNLEVDFTGLSLSNPDNIRFYYRLEGLEDEWVGAGNMRKAFYPYLPPGEYTFSVRALGSNGVWSSNTATLKVRVIPRFWETTAFYVVSLAVIAIVVFLIFLQRIRAHSRYVAEQKDFSRRLLAAHESERRRIATELHDGLGQTLLLIKNWASLAKAESSSDPKLASQLSNIEDAASDSIEETRAIVRNLGPQNLKRFGLTEALENMIEHVEQATGIKIQRTIDNVDGVFSDEEEISIYRVVQECLNNIVKHSESPRAVVQLRRFANFVTVLIEDFGTGIRAVEGTEHGSNGGFGLRGIEQRVNLMGGNVQIYSSEGAGTSIHIELEAGRG
ncbi:MAG: hypothetical protein J5I65_07400 [Aridibacter famidurans]|nr:hypothetical protein [Aridibacter famidurans]